MSMTPEDKLVILQRFVNSFQQDLLAVHAALHEAGTPDAGKRFLIGGLNYAMDMLDMYPDHNKGIGLADDAIVLRLAAKLARAAGAHSASIETLANDADQIPEMFGELAGPLEKMVTGFPNREVRGRTADKIISHQDTRIMFDADIGREAKRHGPQDLGTGDAAKRSIVELQKMFEHALKRANLL